MCSNINSGKARSMRMSDALLDLEDICWNFQEEGPKTKELNIINDQILLQISFFRVFDRDRMCSADQMFFSL